MTAYVIAQDIQTGRILTRELPVSDLTVTWTLSGPQAISGSFPTELTEVEDLGLTPWGTWIHVEEDGIIRASGILQPAAVDQNETLSLDAAGVSAYLKDTPYLGAFTVSGTDPATSIAGVGIHIDPADIARAIWAEVQSYPGSDLGVTVVGATPIRLGTPPQDVNFTTTDPGTGGATDVAFVAGPYSALDWWEHADCGSEFDKQATQTPFDYLERQVWNADRTDVTHWIELGYPRLGTTPAGVRFSEGANLTAAIGPEEPDGRYASDVVVLGAGEGSARIRGDASAPIAGRIRRVDTVDNKTITSVAEATALARTYLAAAQALADVTEITAMARHPDAPLGAYGPGDDVPVRARAPWYGELQLMQRVITQVWNPAADSVKLTLRSSSSFSYLAPGTGT